MSKNTFEIPVKTYTFEPGQQFTALLKAMNISNICALEVIISERWDVLFAPNLWTAGAEDTLGLKLKAPEDTEHLPKEMFQALGQFSLFPYPLNGLPSFPLDGISGPHRTAWIFQHGVVITEADIQDLFKASRFSNSHLATLGEHFAFLVPSNDTAHGKIQAAGQAEKLAQIFSKAILQPQSRRPTSSHLTPWSLFPVL